MDVISGPIGKEYAMERDDRRINQAELRHKASSKEGRTAGIIGGRGGSIV